MRTSVVSYFLQSILLFGLLFSGPGCNHTKTAKDLYDKMRSSARYKTYKTLSERVKYDKVVVREGPAGITAEEEQYMRVLLGYSWIFSGKPIAALAESDIIESRSDRPDEQAMAYTLKRLLLYEMKRVDLVEKESLQEEERVLSLPVEPEEKIQTMVYHLLAGSLALKERKFEKASADFVTFGRITKIQWPWRLADALADIENKDLLSGQNKLNDLVLHSDAPPEVRAVLADVLARKGGNAGQDIDPVQLWPGSFSFRLADQLERSAVQEIKNGGKTLQELREKLVL